MHAGILPCIVGHARPSMAVLLRTWAIARRGFTVVSLSASSAFLPPLLAGEGRGWVPAFHGVHREVFPKGSCPRPRGSGKSGCAIFSRADSTRVTRKGTRTARESRPNRGRISFSREPASFAPSVAEIRRPCQSSRSSLAFREDFGRHATTSTRGKRVLARGPGAFGGVQDSLGD